MRKPCVPSLNIETKAYEQTQFLKAIRNQILLTHVCKWKDTSEENLYVDTRVCVVGFHAVDLDSASVNDLFIPSQVRLMTGFLLVGLYGVPPNLTNEKRT